MNSIALNHIGRYVGENYGMTFDECKLFIYTGWENSGMPAFYPYRITSVIEKGYETHRNN